MEREIYSMDRGWKFHQGDISVLPKINTHDEIYGFAKAGGLGGPASHQFDASKWVTVDVPHDSLIAEPYDKNEAANHNFKKRDVCWYRMQFNLDPKDRDKNLSITFDGISGLSDVYFNGSRIGGSRSGYSSFTVDITDLAHFDSALNVLAVRCDNRQWEGWWYEGGGIYRHVYLTKKPPVFVKPSGIWANPKKQADSWEVPVSVELANCFEKNEVYRVTATLFYENQRIATQSIDGTILGFEEKKEELCLEVENPVLWDINSPTLYRLELSLDSSMGTDLVTTRIGFRTIGIDSNTGFYLNERNVKLKGVCNHLDHGPLGVAVPKEVHRYRLQILKDMGCNAYRCAHNPPPPDLLDLCDEMGILVMDENRNFNSSDAYMGLLQELIKRDRNHPSVVMYSIFNEEPLQGTVQGRRLASRMLAETKKLDNTRPIIGCFNGGFLEEDGAATAFDVTGINYFTNQYDSFKEKFPEQPVLASELVSAFATRGVYREDEEKQVFDNYDSATAPWGQTVQEAWKSVSSRDYIMGQFVWTGFDYKGEPTPYSWPSVSSHFGVIDTCGFPKDTFHLYRAYWKDEPILHLFPHWNFSKGVGTVKVMTYTNCEEVELFVNGVSVGRQQVDLFAQPYWNVSYEPGEIEVIGYQQDKEIKRAKRVTAGNPTSIVLETQKALLYSDNRDALIMNISLADENKTHIPLADNEIEVLVEGGLLLGIGNGDPNSHEPDKTNKRKLFSGYCQAIIQAEESASEVNIVVRSSGLSDANLTVPIKKRKSLVTLTPAYERMIVGWRVSPFAQSTRPDPFKKLAVTDMNTFEPIHFNDQPHSAFVGKANVYLIYTCLLDIFKTDMELFFSKVQGEVEVFLNGERLFHETKIKPSSLHIAIPKKTIDRSRLTVFIKNGGGDDAGILGNVFVLQK